MRSAAIVCALLCCFGCPAADAPDGLTAGAAPTADQVLAAARAADEVYQRHLGELQLRLADADPAVRIAALRQLGRLVDPAAGGAALPFLDPFRRTPAELIAGAETAGDLGVAAAAPALEKLLIHQDPDVRAAAQKNLERLRALTAGHLKGRAADPDSGLRGPAVTDLGTMKHAEAAPLLIQAVRYDASPHIRRMAALGLAKLGDRANAGVLADALCDADPGVRAIAAAGLAHLGAVETVPNLLMALEANVSGAAIDRAVRVLTGQDFGFDPRAILSERQAAVERGFVWWAANAKTLTGK